MVYMETHQCSDLCCHQAGSPVDRCNTSRCINDIILKLGLHFKIVGVLSEDKLSFSQHRSMLSCYLQAACCTTDLIKKMIYFMCCVVENWSKTNPRNLISIAGVLFLDGIKQLLEPMLTSHEMCSSAFTWKQFPKCLWTWPVKCV